MPPPDHISSRFSRRTILAAIDVLQQMTHAELDRFLLELNLHDPKAGYGTSRRARTNSLMRYIENNPGRKADGTQIADVVVEKAVSLLPSDGPMSENQKPLQRALEQEGYSAAHGILRRVLPGDLELPRAEDEITSVLKRHGFGTSLGHLDQALDAHGRGDWAAANSQIRSLVEAMFDEIATKLDHAASSVPGGHPRRSHLAKIGFFMSDLNEWENSGKGFINGLMRRLHPHGSHPGLSDEEDCTFRLHLVLLTARVMLARFNERMRAVP